MSFIDQIAELEKAKAKIAQAEAKLAADRVAALSKLPADFGYSDLNEFIKALKDAEGKSGAKVKAAKAASPKAAKAVKDSRSKRAKITPEVKALVKSLSEAGKTGNEIAVEIGISAPSVQNIKKELGLVKARAVAAPVAIPSQPSLEVSFPPAEQNTL